MIKESKFSNNVKQKWLNNKNILIYSTQNKGKSVVGERFIRKLKGIIY